jgi:hypothetical protein
MKNYILKAISALACVVVLLGLVGAADFSPALHMDTYTDAGNEEQSFGADDTLWVASENGQPIRIAYLTFGGMTTLSQQISSGNLEIYVKEVERPGKVSIHLCSQAAMDTISWADQPEYDPVALGTLDIQGPGWQTCDATAFVTKAALKCSKGCPFSMVLVADVDASISFASMEGSAEKEAVLQYEAS